MVERGSGSWLVPTPCSQNHHLATFTEESLDMTYDIIEQGTPCDFCGQPVEFFDDDWVRCPSCGAEYSNMDYKADDINDSDDIIESDEINELGSFEG